MAEESSRPNTFIIDGAVPLRSAVATESFEVDLTPPDSIQDNNRQPAFPSDMDHPGVSTPPQRLSGAFEEVSPPPSPEASVPSRPTSMTTFPGSGSNASELRPIDEVRQVALEFPRDGPPPRVCDVMPKLGGRTRFRFGGRCITGPSRVDTKFNLFTWAAILAPSAFYFSECTEFLWNISPYIPIATVVLLIACVCFLLLTSCTDPGIIPRYSLRLCVEGLEEQVAVATGCQDIPLDIVSGTRNEQQMVTLEGRGYRWCAFCKMVQPPRAKHCRDCDCCILRNDHHCPFVNNCVGQRNYLYFCLFLASICCLGTSVFTGIGLWANAAPGGVSSSLKTTVLSVIVVPTGLVLLAVLALSLWHLALILRGRTTREVLTGRIYGEGATLFSERGPALIDGTREVHFPGGA